MRRCGDCTLCCKLLPVGELKKPANQPCQHVRRGKGCTIYDHRPRSCRVWSCLWLLNHDTKDLPRPDHARYVIDPMPEFVVMEGELESGKHGRVRIEVTVIWVDPKHPTAYRDPALLEWIEQRSRRHPQMHAALIRFDSYRALTLFPPHLTGAGWEEREGNLIVDQHTPEQIANPFTISGE